MTDFPGPERRNDPDGMQEVLATLRELNRGHREMCRDLKCLDENMKRYEPLLIRLTESKKEYLRLRAAILEKSVIGIFWVIIAFTGMAIWHYFLGLIGRK